MKKQFWQRASVGGMALLLMGLSLAEARRGGYVRGYTRKDGTYVSGYYRGGSGSSSSTYTSPTTRTFSSCAAARAAGYSNMTVGSYGYSSALDRDGDGIACESGRGSSDGSRSASNPTSSTDSFPLPTIPGLASSTSTRVRPAAAFSGVTYFKATDIQTIGGSISALQGNTYVISAFKHSVNVVPNSLMIYNDGKLLKMATAPFVYQGSLYLPSQYLFKLGCNVDRTSSYSVMATCPNYTSFFSTNVLVF